MTHQRPPADTTSPTCKCGHGANSHEGNASCNAHHANWLRDACGCPQYRPAAVYQVTKIRPLTVAQMIGPLFDITEWIGGPRWMVTDPDGREVARCDTQTGAYAIARAVGDVAAMRDRMTRLEQRLYGRHPARSGWKAAHAEMNVDDIAQRFGNQHHADACCGAAKVLGGRTFIAQVNQRVLYEGMIDDMDRHRVRLYNFWPDARILRSCCDSHAGLQRAAADRRRVCGAGGRGAVSALRAR